jgi:hypothetical protein
MRFCRTSIIALAIAALALLAASAASGQDEAFSPIRTKPYAFLPKQSTLAVDYPGLEVATRLLPVFGRFDIGYYATPGAVGFGPTAKFLNVRAWAGNPLSATAAAPIDLDQALNLSGLIGRPLPVASLFDVYEFKGQNSDGAAVDIFASMLGPWVRLRGGTTPSAADPHTVDYQLNALAHLRPKADFNSDDQVDAHDLAAWTTSFGSVLPGATDSAATDGPLTGADFLAWQQQLGETPPSAAAFDAAISAAIANQSANTAAVPEPATLLALLAGLAGLLHHRCRKGVRAPLAA